MSGPVVGVLVSVVVAIVGGVLASLIYEHFKNRTYVRRIKKTNDRDIDDFLDLYERLFDESVRISSEEILRWVEEDRRATRRSKNPQRRDYLLVCKIGDRVVAFMKAMYSGESGYMFIAYYGVDKKSPRARAVASTIMVKALIRLAKRELQQCRALVFEVERPDASLSTAENLTRKARIRLFKEVARRWHYRVYIIQIPYIQPEMPLDPGETTEETYLSLLFLPTDTSVRRRRISKGAVLSILRFIYLRIYGPTFADDPVRNEEYQAYLRSLLRRYELTLPAHIPLEE